MLQLDIYTFVTLLSSVVIFVMSICLIVVSVPKDAELQNYRVARRFLAVAYLILAAVGQWEVWDDVAVADVLMVRAFTLITAAFQALLFTFSIITMINMQYMTARRVWTNVIITSLVSCVLLIVLFIYPSHFYPVFYTALFFYCLQLTYYITEFVREYRHHRQRLDNYFSGNEHRRINWIRNVFFLTACVGLGAIGALFVNREMYIGFTIIYTISYVYFAVKYINYVTLFYRIAPAIISSEELPEDIEPEYDDRLQESLEQWIGSKKYLYSDVTLEGLATELNTNQSYLSRRINSRYEQNFRSWINSLRINESILLMKTNPSYSMPEIAERIGISSISTFYRQFSTVIGMTPQEYKKQINSPNNTIR